VLYFNLNIPKGKNRKQWFKREIIMTFAKKYAPRARPEPVEGYPRALEETLQPAFAKATAGTASSHGRCLLLSLTKHQGERRQKLYKHLLRIDRFN
jgi:hypothetical protein